MGIESPLHLLFLGAVALIVLGPKRLPELARALGKGIREFRGAFDEAAAPQTVAAPVIEREQPTEQLAVAPMTVHAGAGTQHAGAQQAGFPTPAGAQQAGTEQAGARQAEAPPVGTPQAGTPQAGTPQAGTPQAGTPQAGTEHAGPVVQGRPEAGPESPG